MTPTTATTIAGILAVPTASLIASLVAILARRDDQTDDVEEAPTAAPAPAEPVERRRLVPGWADLLQPPPVPELDVPGEPRAALVRPYVEYVGRHQEDTVDLARVAPDWMPPVGAARLRAAVTETAEMDISEVIR